VKVLLTNANIIKEVASYVVIAVVINPIDRSPLFVGGFYLSSS
jgi:hypothetical protein